jgi:hypothetical protein
MGAVYHILWTLCQESLICNKKKIWILKTCVIYIIEKEKEKLAKKNQPKLLENLQGKHASESKEPFFLDGIITKKMETSVMIQPKDPPMRIRIEYTDMKRFLKINPSSMVLNPMYLLPNLMEVGSSTDLCPASYIKATPWCSL